MCVLNVTKHRVLQTVTFKVWHFQNMHNFFSAFCVIVSKIKSFNDSNAQPLFHIFSHFLRAYIKIWETRLKYNMKAK